MGDYSQDLALPVLFHKCWDAHENRDSLTDAEIEVPNIITVYYTLISLLDPLLWLSWDKVQPTINIMVY